MRVDNGRTKAGDLVIRKVDLDHTQLRLRSAVEQRNRLGHGIVLSTYTGGNPAHTCLEVFYPKVGKIYDIAESLMEVISEGR